MWGFSNQMWEIWVTNRVMCLLRGWIWGCKKANMEEAEILKIFNTSKTNTVKQITNLTSTLASNLNTKHQTSKPRAKIREIWTWTQVWQIWDRMLICRGSRRLFNKSMLPQARGSVKQDTETWMRAILWENKVELFMEVGLWGRTCMVKLDMQVLSIHFSSLFLDRQYTCRSHPRRYRIGLERDFLSPRQCDRQWWEFSSNDWFALEIY